MGSRCVDREAPRSLGKLAFAIGHDMNVSARGPACRLNLGQSPQSRWRRHCRAGRADNTRPRLEGHRPCQPRKLRAGRARHADEDRAGRQTRIPATVQRSDGKICAAGLAQ